MFEIELAKAQLDLELARIQAEFDSLVPDEFTASEVKSNGRTPLIAAANGGDDQAEEEDEESDPEEEEEGETPLPTVVEDFLLEHAGAHNALHMSATLKANPDSVRSILSKLYRTGRIKRVARGVYTSIPGVTGKG